VIHTHERFDMKKASLIRVFVILAVVMSVATVVVTQFMVRPHIKAIVEEREANRSNWQQELARANKLMDDLKETEGKLASAEKSLEETDKQLAAARERAGEQQRRADTLQRNLEVAMRELKETQQKFAQWKALPIPVETVKAVIESEKRLRLDNVILKEKLEVARAENKRLTDLLASVTRPDDAPPMPGVKGSIVAVDPKWNFVVLDVGEKAGAKQRGVFMVSRDGKLIGKVEVATVQPDRSIANVMPGWQLEEMMEGDQVLF
jgi:septal ring factor EnvC (AmiA/AmiB activator)